MSNGSAYEGLPTLGRVERVGKHEPDALGQFLTRVCATCGAPLVEIVARGDMRVEFACTLCHTHTGYTRYSWRPSAANREGADDMPTSTEHDQDLPGMEDRAIGALEKLAVEYGHLRDARAALKEQKATLDRRAVAAMKKAGKLHYRRNGIVIEITAAEIVKVTIPKGATDDADDQLRHGAAREH